MKKIYSLLLLLSVLTLSGCTETPTDTPLLESKVLKAKISEKLTSYQEQLDSLLTAYQEPESTSEGFNQTSITPSDSNTTTDGYSNYDRLLYHRINAMGYQIDDRIMIFYGTCEDSYMSGDLCTFENNGRTIEIKITYNNNSIVYDFVEYSKKSVESSLPEIDVNIEQYKFEEIDGSLNFSYITDKYSGDLSHVYAEFSYSENSFKFINQSTNNFAYIEGNNNTEDYKYFNVYYDNSSIIAETYSNVIESGLSYNVDFSTEGDFVSSLFAFSGASSRPPFFYTQMQSDEQSEPTSTYRYQFDYVSNWTELHPFGNVIKRADESITLPNMFYDIACTNDKTCELVISKYNLSEDEFTLNNFGLEFDEVSYQDFNNLITNIRQTVQTDFQDFPFTNLENLSDPDRDFYSYQDYVKKDFGLRTIEECIDILK